ncbi:MAG: histidine kinase [Selenomonadaceae bacterium]|nr:histidine kinase [Selenomonadaceae bacterium]
MHQEIAHQRANIMVLQMRPHFIYNAKMSIYYFCAKDSKKAQQVTLDFTTCLRKNFTAIVSENPIPFSDELERYTA